MDENTILEDLFVEDIGSVKWILLIKELAVLSGLTEDKIKKIIKGCKSTSNSLQEFKQCVKDKLNPKPNVAPKNT